MKIHKPILIFGYSFPHKKTYDFITILFALGFRNIMVVGAPKLKLAQNENSKSADKKTSNSYCVKTLCRALSIEFEECPHDDIQRLSKINNRMQAQTAIVSGARILKREVIDLFPNGIINFHPGMIPETSGLDSFYHSIAKNCPMGVTVHLIDHKVDAGRFIFFEKLRVESGQTIEVVRENLYGVQLIALKKYLKYYFDEISIFPEINRPKKNQPLSTLEKENLAISFPQWISDREKAQYEVERHFFEMCAHGDLEGLKALIETDSYLLNCRNPEGWTGIIISSFWQRYDVVKYLLELGANPNDSGFKGTTVLMYAKTKLLEKQGSDFSLLKLLLDAGANLHQRDNLNKNIFDYLNTEITAEMKLHKYLKAFDY